jgi:MYXO-CTERM domain-containing protein
MNAIHRSRRLSLSTVVVASVAASLLACSSTASTSDGAASSSGPGDLGQVASPVIKGKNSDTSQDAVVLLVHFDGSPNVGACTGTLLSDRVILTARHCVADTDESAACDVTGKPLAQGVVRGNHPASTLYAFVGPNRPDFNSGNVSPDGQGLKILDDGGTNLCNHDIALVILQKPIPNAKIAQIRLDSPILQSDILTAIGWGVTEKTDMPTIRQQRSGIGITGIGPDMQSGLPLPPNEFQVGESICSGDSGGPALAQTGAIVGIVSRGGNGSQPDPNNPSSSCVNGVQDAENIYTKVSPFKKFITDGLASIGAEPWLEGGADPRLLKPDEACTDDSQCRSNICLAPSILSTDKVCTLGCAADPTSCPDGQTCNTVGGAQICQTAEAAATTNNANATANGAGGTKTTTTSCSVSQTPGSRSTSGSFGLVLGALGICAVAGLRRRRA